LKYNNSSAVEAVASTLRAKIINGEIQPGEKMKEISLTKELNVSRTPIREAFRILQSEGLLKYIPNRGVIVADGLDPQKVYEMICVWGILSASAAFHAAGSKDDEKKAQLMSVQSQMEREPFEAIKMTKLDYQLHRIVGELSGSSVLCDYIDDIQKKLEGFMYATRFNEKRYSFSIKEHRNMVEAIVAGNAELARIYTQLHFELSAQFHRDNIQEFNKRIFVNKRI